MKAKDLILGSDDAAELLRDLALRHGMKENVWEGRVPFWTAKADGLTVEIHQSDFGSWEVDISIYEHKGDDGPWRRVAVDQAEPVLARAFEVAEEKAPTIAWLKYAVQVQTMYRAMDREWGFDNF
jgi:hypothetical protein